MGRPATGSPKWDPKTKKWLARITVPGKGRVAVSLDDIPPCEAGTPGTKCPCASCQQARRVAKLVSDTSREEGRVPAETRETVNEWSERWLKDREARGLTSARDDRSRLKVHVLPLLGTFVMADVPREQIEDLVTRLDARVRAGETSWKTARHAWALTTRMFRDAKASKRRDLRVRDDNPTTDVEGPDRGARKVKQFLFPSEFMQLVTTARVPLHWRRLFAIAVYTYARGGELAALEWEDVDLERGLVHVHRAVDRLNGGTKATKTNVARRFPIEPNLIPLLATMRAEAGGEKATGAVLPFMANKSEWSKNLHQYLRWAGVKRADLFTDDATRKRLTFHDLRSTGITWCAVRGDEPLKIMQRAGHEDFKTTQIYIRLAESFVDTFGEPFLALPPDTVGVTSNATEEGSGVLVEYRLSGQGTETIARKTRGTKWANRDLNPKPMD